MATSICHFGQPKRWNILMPLTLQLPVRVSTWKEKKTGKKKLNSLETKSFRSCQQYPEKKAGICLCALALIAKYLKLQVFHGLKLPTLPRPPDMNSSNPPTHRKKCRSHQPANLRVFPNLSDINAFKKGEKKWSKEIITKSALVSHFPLKHLMTHVTFEFLARNYFGALLQHLTHTMVVFVDKKLWLVNLTPLTPYHLQKCIRETNEFPDSISPRHF